MLKADGFTWHVQFLFFNTFKRKSSFQAIICIHYHGLSLIKFFRIYILYYIYLHIYICICIFFKFTLLEAYLGYLARYCF